MMTHEAMAEAFGDDWVMRMPPATAKRYVSSEADRRVLTEVGLPKMFTDILVFGDYATDEPRTVGSIFSTVTEERAKLGNDLVIASGMGGLTCLSGDDGRVYWYNPGDTKRNGALINSTLDHFAATLHQVWVLLADLHPADESDVGRMLRALVPEVGAIDPPAFESPVKYWQLLMLFSLRSFVSP
ncbi:SUKH-4 family immunity protein [Streptomyces sp. NPDC127049]|uniref:SUKH-4 family immunity protein n=1 Tax=Streptomyces sp. NPDC127049 TaxID=3347118 RepID=UPI0036628922